MKSELVSKAHTAPYKIHKYFARRPYNLFEYLIQEYTSEGDLVLDPFMGGGVTVYESVKLGRRAVGLDYNPLSEFIVDSMLQNKFPDKFLEATKEIEGKLCLVYEKYFQEKSGVPDWYDLTFEVNCNHCGKITDLSNKNMIKTALYKCLKCGKSVVPHKCFRLGTKYISYVKNGVSNPKSTISKKHKDGLLFLKKNIVKEDLDTVNSEIPMDWDRQSEDKLFNKGIVYFSDFFTEKNLYLNLYLKKIIDSYRLDTQLHRSLRLILSSSLRDTGIMAFTSDGWQGGKPATWSKHAFWIPSQFCELNILDAFKRAKKRYISAIDFNKNSDFVSRRFRSVSGVKKSVRGYFVAQGDSGAAKLPSSSFDFILTDPPYGSNVQYRELSSYWNIWNKDLYSFELNVNPKEAVVNRKLKSSTSKDYENYELLLGKVFLNCFNSLKMNGLMAMTFNNKDLRSWVSLIKSVFDAGFVIREDLIFFQSGVKNYKQTAHTKSDGTFYGDFVLFFQKVSNSNSKRKQKHSICLKEKIKKEVSILNRDERIGTEYYLEMYKIILPLIWEYLYSKEADTSDLYEVFSKDLIDKL